MGKSSEGSRITFGTILTELDIIKIKLDNILIKFDNILIKSDNILIKSDNILIKLDIIFKGWENRKIAYYKGEGFL